MHRNIQQLLSHFQNTFIIIPNPLWFPPDYRFYFMTFSKTNFTFKIVYVVRMYTGFIRRRNLHVPGPGKQIRYDFSNGPSWQMKVDFSNRPDHQEKWFLYRPGLATKKKDEKYCVSVWANKTIVLLLMLLNKLFNLHPVCSFHYS